MYRRTLAPMLTYVRAAPLPHLLTVVSVAVSEVVAVLACLAESGLVSWPLRISSLGWLGLALLAQADAFCRWREYRRVKAMFDRWGYYPRMLSPLARSRCQRDAGMYAAKEAGFGHLARAHYRTLGYRWYHLMPDLVVQNPVNFLSPGFLKATFVPTRKAGLTSSVRELS